MKHLICSFGIFVFGFLLPRTLLAMDKAALSQALSESFGSHVHLSCYADPCFQQADFDGDEKPDLAILVEEDETHKKGIAFVHGNREHYLAGLGKPSSKKPVGDLSWVKSWKLYPKNAWEGMERDSSLPKGAAQGAFLFLSGEEDSSGDLIFWNGKEYQRSLVGD